MDESFLLLFFKKEGLSKRFFFEKKKQKTSAHAACPYTESFRGRFSPAPRMGPNQNQKINKRAPARSDIIPP
jgi:hypothetical protein